MRKSYLVIIAIVVFLGFSGFFYLNFIRATGFKTQNELIDSFVENIPNNDVCETHFVNATFTSCKTFVDLLVDDTVSVKSSTAVQDEVIVVLTINGNDAEFRFYFDTTLNTGIKSFFNKQYFLIEYIE